MPAAAVCSIDGCGKKVKARGWCSGHYNRWNLYGDPLAPRRSKSATQFFDDGTKACSCCGERKPFEQFYVDKRGIRGRGSRCKVCFCRHQRQWYRNNAEVENQKSRQYRRRNREAIREYEKKRYQRDKPKRIALAVEHAHRRRQRLAESERFDKGINSYALRDRDGDRCAICDKSMDFAPGVVGEYNPRRASVEHLKPIHLGGLHVWENVALTCLACNLSRPKDGSDDLVSVG